MNSSKEYWEKRFKGIDFDTFDFSKSEPEKPLVSFCKKYIKRDVKVLDLGCGGGRNSQYLAQQGFVVYGIDISHVAVELCRKRFKKFNLEGKFEPGTFDGIPFPDNYFSFVVCIAAFDHDTYDNATKSIEEIRRVLADNGLILFTFDPPIRTKKFSMKPKYYPTGHINLSAENKKGCFFTGIKTMKSDFCSAKKILLLLSIRMTERA